jgi:signal peptidase II
MTVTTGRAVLLVAVLSTIGCDQVTKRVATTVLAGGPERSYLADTIRIGYVENAGGFLSLGAHLPPVLRTMFFTGITGAVLVAAAILAVLRHWNRAAMLGLTLFVAGGASNWIDRVLRGSVVDFLNVGVGPIRTGVFNVADMAILLGATLLVIGEYSHGRRHRP